MSTSPRFSVRAERLTAAAWAAFGWLPVADTDPADASFEYEFAWNDTHVNVITHTADDVERSGDALVCDRFFRHESHTQVLLPLDAESVIVVAPASTSFADRSDLAAVRAFRLAPLDGITLFRGTWHWGPFPTGAVPVRLWNVQGKRYTEDNACADLSALLGTALEITR